jgi:hypothetical protein
LHPEDKFLNGDYADQGKTLRRIINVQSIQYIGKEANKWEEQVHLGFDPDAQIEYGVSPEEYESNLQLIKDAVLKFGAKEIATLAGLSKRYVNYICDGKRKPKENTLKRVLMVIKKLSNLNTIN